MSAEVIPFPQGPESNGAREALERILDAIPLEDLEGSSAPLTDTILLMLAAAGYVIVPIDGLTP